MKMQNKYILPLLVTLAIATTSCSRSIIRKSLGVKQDAPDEFMVQPQKKLEIPEELPTSLPQPTFTKKKLLEKYNPISTLTDVFGKEDNDFDVVSESPLENKILEKTSSKRILKNVRKEIESDYKDRSSIFGTAPGGVMESILDPFGYNRDKPNVIDGKKENARIRKAIAKGESALKSKPIIQREEGEDDGWF